MEINCEWCGGKARNGENTVYWELPDGSRTIEITIWFRDLYLFNA
ncbi:YgiT-type zinc finger protein [Cytobacillus suaedae]|nr:YgiT-type zinc finger protein [Cytobacillus suaedae]